MIDPRGSRYHVNLFILLLEKSIFILFVAGNEIIDGRTILSQKYFLLLPLVSLHAASSAYRERF